MAARFDRRETLVLLWSLIKWGILGAWVGILSGTASAVFLRSLDWATETRTTHPWLLFLLPIAGMVVAGLYSRFGKEVAGGNNLLLDRIHEPGPAIPFRMAPLILLTTVITHLFGGSAGREGTAVQMGGTLGQLAASPLRLSARDRRLLIMAGVAGGFGSVFGTPLAGTVFALEVLAIGRIGYDALIPCLLASVVGDQTTRALGVGHVHYAPLVGALPALGPASYAWIGLAGALFAGAAIAFTELTHAIQNAATRISKRPWLRAACGGVIVILITLAIGNQDYNGLSLPLIRDSFGTSLPLGAFAIKLLLTAITLGFGFKGGEVTPLFCIGAALGNAFAQVTHQPVALFAALGFVAVFAGAANTPLACTIMGIELFGSEFAVPLAIACVTSYVLSGHRGIYLSQQVRYAKGSHVQLTPGVRLREVQESPPPIRTPHLWRLLRKEESTEDSSK